VRASSQQAKAEGQQRLHTILTRALYNWLRCAQTEFELSPIVRRTQQL
jgi:hypothetical protein